MLDISRGLVFLCLIFGLWPDLSKQVSISIFYKPDIIVKFINFIGFPEGRRLLYSWSGGVSDDFLVRKRSRLCGYN